jgi:hypothetical protein
MKLSSSIVILSAISQSVNGFNLNPQTQVSRRDAFTNAASGMLGTMFGLSTVFPNAAVAYPAEETPRVVNRMGGLLVSAKGLSIVTLCITYIYIYTYLTPSHHHNGKLIHFLFSNDK